MAHRDLIHMTEAEVSAVLSEGRRAQFATHNPDGTIHLVPMEYVLYEDRVTLWTDPGSRKVENVKEDPRVTCLIELGGRFEEFRAVQLVGTGELVTELDESRRIGEALFSRTLGDLTDDVRAYVANLATQRVGIRIHPTRVVSWDHRKLAGARPDQVGS